VLVPQILALLAFLTLAREAGSISLWRSSIGVFGSTWLMAVYAIDFAGPQGGGLWEALITVAVGVGLVFLLVLVSRRPSAFPQPAPEASPTPQPAVDPPKQDEASADPAEKPRPGKSAWGWAAIIFAFVAARILRKVVRRTAFDWGQVGHIACIVLVCCLLCALVAFVVWFGISKIRLRHKLGSMAAVSGGADLVSAALNLAFYLLLAFATVRAASHLLELDWSDPSLRIPATMVDVFDLAWKALFAVLFVSIRGRIVHPKPLVPGGV
jgi:hypothetical protein